MYRVSLKLIQLFHFTVSVSILNCFNFSVSLLSNLDYVFYILHFLKLVFISALHYILPNVK